MDAVVIRAQERRQTAPAAADIQHLLARAQGQLGRDMPHFRHLRLGDGLLAGFEIGAGILHGRVEEQAEELVRQIVVELHVAPRPVDGSDLDHPVDDRGGGLAQLVEENRKVAVRHAAHQHGQHLAQIAFLDFEIAVHVAFGQEEARRHEQLGQVFPAFDPHHHPGRRRSRDAIGNAVRADQNDRSGLDDASKQTAEQHLACP